MTRTQTVLLALATLALGRAAGDVLLPAAGGALAQVVGLAVAAIRGTPAWVGWGAFSAVWWLPCALRRGRCGARSCTPAS